MEDENKKVDQTTEEETNKAGLLDKEGVDALFELHESDDTPVSTQVQLDAVINHMIGIQVLHRHFVDTDIPAKAKAKAEELHWHP